MHFTKNTLGKDERLKSRKLIKELFEHGKVLNQYPFKVLYQLKQLPEERYPVKFAVSVSKRNFKLAVDRNRIKRKVREAYRLNKLPIYSILAENDQNLLLFVIYTAKEEFEFQKLDKEIQLVLQKLLKRLNDKSE